MAAPGVIGPDVATAVPIGQSAAIGIVVSAVVIGSFTRECFGRSRAALIAAALLLAANVALATARSPFAMIATWQLECFLAWSLCLFFADEDVQAWLGRLLVAGWLTDAILVMAALALLHPGSEEPESGARVLSWGCALAIAGRLAALPIGVHQAWADRSPRPALAWMLIVTLPPATILGLRLIDIAQLAPISRLNVCGFLLFVGVTVVMGSLHQESDLREIAWRVSGALAALTAISLLISPWSGRLLWIFGALGCAYGVRRIPDWLPARVTTVHSATLLGRLEVMAADEWGFPRAWRFAIEMPSRGAAHMLRFFDGVIFEQLPRQGLSRLAAAGSPVARAVPELFGRLLMPILFSLAFIVLLALAFR